MWRALIIACNMVLASTILNAQTQQFDKQGHRGCRGLMPENTIPAMLKAIDLGVTTLEMDVVFAADKKAVLSHEPYFSSSITTKPDGTFMADNEEKSFNIYKMPYAEVAKYDVGMKPNRRFPRQQKLKAVKPLLEDVIDTVEAYIRQNRLPPVFYNIETKTKPSTDNIFHPAPADFVDLLMEVINRKKMAGKVTIQSFDIRTLQYLHKKYPDVKTSLLIERLDKFSPKEKLKALGFTPTVLSPEFTMVSSSLVKLAHTQGMKIIPWTVNNAAAIKRLKQMNVDGIISDYPDLFK